jgi:RES domain-containing protein
MILSAIGPDAPFHRAFTPRWAHAPESGAGAALAGGRFNRPGVPARYLAADPETALAEYRGESPLLPPATLVTFLVTAARVVDFTGGHSPDQWTPIWAEACCNWKGLAFLQGVEPPSWVIGDLVRTAGHAGILYRSTRHEGGSCLVLFPQSQDFTATVHDPGGLLPRDVSSWKSSRKSPRRRRARTT